MSFPVMQSSSFTGNLPLRVKCMIVQSGTSLPNSVSRRYLYHVMRTKLSVSWISGEIYGVYPQLNTIYNYMTWVIYSTWPTTFQRIWKHKLERKNIENTGMRFESKMCIGNSDMILETKNVLSKQSIDWKQNSDFILNLETPLKTCKCQSERSNTISELETQISLYLEMSIWTWKHHFESGNNEKIIIFDDLWFRLNSS